jgi:hypothetical protein
LWQDIEHLLAVVRTRIDRFRDVDKWCTEVVIPNFMQVGPVSWFFAVVPCAFLLFFLPPLFALTLGASCACAGVQGH